MRQFAIIIAVCGIVAVVQAGAATMIELSPSSGDVINGNASDARISENGGSK